MNSTMTLSKTSVSNARGSPQGTQMPSPRTAIKFRMPHPWDWQREQMPRGCPGEMGTAGIDWCIIQESQEKDAVLKIFEVMSGKEDIASASEYLPEQLADKCRN